jgi:hypothetical protein
MNLFTFYIAAGIIAFIGIVVLFLMSSHAKN